MDPDPRSDRVGVADRLEDEVEQPRARPLEPLRPGLRRIRPGALAHGRQAPTPRRGLRPLPSHVPSHPAPSVTSPAARPAALTIGPVPSATSSSSDIGDSVIGTTMAPTERIVAIP